MNPTEHMAMDVLHQQFQGTLLSAGWTTNNANKIYSFFSKSRTRQEPGKHKIVH
ncbi:MAG: hypothetical protein CM15mP83_5370 [Flavobacteriaceae bacterium]|nr:MAG: hypothetical protein CM15mP83_5370 [Flavobacteriaceae bacterium]